MTLRFELSDPRYEPPRIRHAVVRSERLGRRADISFVTPPVGTRAELVVVLLHGVYGSHWSWLYRGGALQRLMEAESSAAVRPMLVVMPSDGLWGDGSAYLDIGSERHEEWIMHDVLDVAWAIADDRPPAVIGGLSMGGFGALRLAARHPQTFRGAFAHSAVVRLDDHRRFGATPWDRADQPLAEALAGLDTAPAIRFDCGIDDALLESNRRLAHELREASVSHTYLEHPGGHDWDYWSCHLPASLVFASSC
jgi:enterochelin esterase-like enzyme